MRGGGRRGGGGGSRVAAKGGGGFQAQEVESEDVFEGLEEAEDFAEEDDFDSDELALHDELVLPVALPVMGGPLPPSDEPPKDADEYLRRVQWERMHLSEVVDVDVVEKPVPRKRERNNKKCSMLTQFDAPEVPENRRYSSAWAEDVLAAFRDLRARCAEAREACEDEQEGDEEDENTLNARSWRESGREHRPSTAALAALDLVSIHDLLAAVIDSIIEGQEHFCGSKDAETQPADTNVAKAPFGLGAFLAEWAFAVMAFVEEPLVDDIQFNLQRLRRACQKFIVSAHTLAESGARQFDSVAHTQASLLLVIVREHFGQR